VVDLLSFSTARNQRLGLDVPPQIGMATSIIGMGCRYLAAEMTD